MVCIRVRELGDRLRRRHLREPFAKDLVQKRLLESRGQGPKGRGDPVILCKGARRLPEVLGITRLIARAVYEHRYAVEISVHGCARVPAHGGHHHRGREAVVAQVGYKLVLEAHVRGRLGAVGTPDGVLAAPGDEAVVIALAPRQHFYRLPESEVVGDLERADRKVISRSQLTPPGGRSDPGSRSQTPSGRTPRRGRTRDRCSRYPSVLC